MVAITRQVSQLSEASRKALEGELGTALRPGQQIRIQVSDIVDESQPPQPKANVAAESTLPEWCNVYEGLSEQEVSAVEAAILQRDKSSRSVVE